MSRIAFRIVVNQKLTFTNQSVITVTTDSDALSSSTISFITVAVIMGVFCIVCLAIIGFLVKKQRKKDAFKGCMDF